MHNSTPLPTNSTALPAGFSSRSAAKASFLGGMMRSVNRTMSFFSKWMAEVVRQPWLMLSLVIGPFLVLLMFGQGMKLGIPYPRAILVRPPGVESEGSIAPTAEDLDNSINVVGETNDMGRARTMLRNGDLDMVAVLPPDPLSTIRQGQRAPVHILLSEIDPVRQTYAHTYISDQVSRLNQETIQKAIGKAQGSVDQVRDAASQGRQYVHTLQSTQGDVERARGTVRELKLVVDPLTETAGQAATAMQGASFVIPGFGRPSDQARRMTEVADSLKRNVDHADRQLSADSTLSDADLVALDRDLAELERATADVKTIPAWVLSAPFELELENVAPVVPNYTSFYGPAVLALLLQHLAITLGALSMARIRLLGLMELLRTSPVRPSESVMGNYLSYGVLCAVAGGLLAVLLVFALGVPVIGSPLIVAGTLTLLVLSSLGIGFVISMLASSEQQAAQLAMLVLIASVFFSGFVVALESLSWPYRAVSYGLPATYAIRTLQDVMLRGLLREPLDLVVLGVVSVIGFFITLQLFRREYRAR